MSEESIDLKSLSYNDRLNICSIFLALVSKGSDQVKSHPKNLESLFDRLQIGPEDRSHLKGLIHEDLDPTTFAKAITNEATGGMVLWDLLVLAVSGGTYDARYREGLKKIANAMAIPWGRVVAAEEAIAAELYQLQASSHAGPRVRKTSKGRRWKVAAAALAGGAALAVTGGLAAPAVGGAVGTYFMGLSGAAAIKAGLAALGGGALATGGLGMAGGTAAVATLFGASGAAVFGKKMATRTGAVQEFQFENLGGHGMHITLAISGWLSAGDNFSSTWAAISEHPSAGQKVALRWESKHQLALGAALFSLSSKEFAKSAATFWAKRGSKAAARILAWPTLLLQFADVIDNPWHVAADRAEKTGLELAEVLRDRIFGPRPVSLIGFSLGSRVILHTLEELARTEDHGLIQHAILMGAAVSGNPERWAFARSVVAGRMVNAYCTSDWILGFLYRTAQATTEVAGLGPIDIPTVENIDVSGIATGHLKYRSALGNLLSKIGFDHRADFRPVNSEGFHDY